VRADAIALIALFSVAPVRADGEVVPQQIADQVTQRAVDRGVPPEAVLAPVVEAAKRGVPPDLVAAKVLEGLAKGAPPERIAAVARALGERLAEAAALLEQAREARLAVREERGESLSDLAGALGQGVPPEAIRELVSAARAGGGSGDSVVAAARTLGDLLRRGVAVEKALPLARILAARPPLPAGSLAALYDVYRAEGGREPQPFLDEAEKRTAAGVALDGMVDHFGDTSDGIVKSGSQRRHGGDHPDTPRVHGSDVLGTDPGPPGLQIAPGQSKPRKK
jgi:hypothetical protein